LTRVWLGPVTPGFRVDNVSLHRSCTHAIRSRTSLRPGATARHATGLNKAELKSQYGRGPACARGLRPGTRPLSTWQASYTLGYGEAIRSGGWPRVSFGHNRPGSSVGERQSPAVVSVESGSPLP